MGDPNASTIDSASTLAGGTTAAAAAAAPPPVRLFYSYAHEDEPLRDELQGHLKILERRGLLAPWHDRQIVAGSAWDRQIDEHLRSADLVLLLISKDFIESDYIFGVELAAAMTRHERQESVVVPVVVRAVDLDPDDADAFPFLKLQGLPTDLRPVTSWPNRDEAWTNVAKGIRGAVKAIQARAAVAPAGAEPPVVVSASVSVAVPVPVPVAPAQRSPGPAVPVAEHAAPAARSLPAPDPVLQRVVDEVVERIGEAQLQRGGAPIDRVGLILGARALIDQPEPRRILWVDDRPEGNTFERAALAKLQIEVVTATSTDEALARVAESARADSEKSGDDDRFHLVITDWSRPAEPPDAALLLMRKLRDAGCELPVIVYHFAFDDATRAARAAAAKAAGAVGEAVFPSDLMLLVARALEG